MRVLQLTIIAIFLFLTGCVTGTRNLENLSMPEFEAGKTASGTVYIASIEDNRVFEQKPSSPSTPSVDGDLSKTSKETLSTLIGRQRNGYGKAMGDVALPPGVTVQDKVRELMTVGLESRGYTVVNDASAENTVTVDIQQFWAWFSPGFAAVSFESRLQCNVDFQGASNELTEEINGYGINKGQVASNANWELAFKRAFEEFLINLDKSLDEKGL